MRESIRGITFSILLLGLLHTNGAASVNIGINAGIKFTTDTLYKDIYGSSNPTFGVVAGVDLFWRFQLVGEYNYFRDKGRMTISEEELTFTNQSWNIGLRAWLFTLIRSSVYIGFGATGYSYAEDLPDRFDDFDDKKAGLYFELGDYYPLIGNRVFLDLNIKYEKVDVQPFNEKVGLGGLKTVIGFRVYF